MQEIQLIQQIQNLTRDANWTPGITSMSYLTYAERAEVCGYFPTPSPRSEAVEEEIYEAIGNVDLRKKGIVTPIRNQSKCGSCWAFAMVGCVEIALGGGTLDLSEQQLVSCCTDCMGCKGGYISVTGQWIINNGGLVEERMYPYTSGATGENGSCNTPTDAQKYTISAVHELGWWDPTSDVKNALDNGHAVDTGMYGYQDFMHYKSGIYKHVSGDMAGGHAVVIVGYNDSERYWLIKNSWSSNWGEDGYFRIAYGECNIPMQACYVTR
jgi:C1A family cysteine protease